MTWNDSNYLNKGFIDEVDGALDRWGGSGGGSGGDEKSQLDALIDGSITEVNSDVEKVGDYAFYRCKSLTTVNLPMATSLGNNVFSYCSALITVNLPAVKSIGSSVFQDCSALTALILRSEMMVTLSTTNAFTSTPIASGTGYIYVPAALVDTYKAATNWSTYADQFRALEDYTVDGTITGELDESKI